MTALSNYLENALINEVLRNTGYTPAATVYLALFTTATTEAGGGTEVTGGSYARQAITFGAPSDGASNNTATISFTNLPAATITHAAIMDASTSGNMLLHGPLQNPRIVAAADSVTFAAGALVASLA